MRRPWVWSAALSHSFICVVSIRAGGAVSLRDGSDSVLLAFGNLTLEKGLDPKLIGPSSVTLVFFGQCFTCRSQLEQKALFKSTAPLSFSDVWGTVWLIFRRDFFGNVESWGEKKGRVFNHVSLQQHFPVNLCSFGAPVLRGPLKQLRCGQRQEGKLAAGPSLEQTGRF